MLYGLLLAIMIIDGLVLGVVILLQSGKGGGLAAVGGGAAATDGVLAGRQATTLLTRTTWTTGTIFLSLAFVLSIMSSRASGTSESLVRGQLENAAPAVPTSVNPNAAGAGAGGILPPPTSGDAGAGDAGGTPPGGAGGTDPAAGSGGPGGTGG